MWINNVMSDKIFYEYYLTSLLYFISYMYYCICIPFKLIHRNNVNLKICLCVYYEKYCLHLYSIEYMPPPVSIIILSSHFIIMLLPFKSISVKAVNCNQISNCNLDRLSTWLELQWWSWRLNIHRLYYIFHVVFWWLN